MSEDRYSGRCLGGLVAVWVVKANATAAVFNCAHCQKQTGFAFSPVLIAPMTDIIVTGELRSYDDTNDRGDRVTRMFCPNCGSPILTKPENDEADGMHVVKAGILDGGAPRPIVEVFTRSRRPWIPDLDVSKRFASGPE